MDLFFPVKVIEDPLAETSWEKRVYTTIKIKNGCGKNKGDVVFEVEPDYEGLELSVVNNLVHTQ